MSGMIICYVGNFSQSHCTEVHLSKTLEDLGHEVIRIQEDSLSSSDLHERIATEAASWSLFLYTRTWGKTVQLTHLTQLKNLNIPTASYHLDLYVGLERKYLHDGKSLDEVLQTDPFWRTDFVFTPDGDPNSQEVFKRNGVNHYYMKPGVFKPECYITDIPRNDDEDVVFVGGGDTIGSGFGYGHSEWAYRDKLITWLNKTYGIRFRKYGNPHKTIRNDELNRVYAESKVVVGDSVCLDFKHTYYWSDRVYETLGRGGFIIHPFIKGLEEEFTDGENIVFYEYNNWDQLKEKIDYYLENDAAREKIRLAGHEFVKNNATYTNRLSRMLELIQEST